MWATTDNGSTYALLATYAGTALSWSQATIDLTAYAGVPSLRVAFQVMSNASITGDGWYIDDIAVANIVVPSSFGKTSPVNGTTGQVTNPTLIWEASNGATSYEYCYGRLNNACDTPWLSAGVLTSAGVSGLANGTTYFWQVRSRRGLVTTEANSGTWSSFTTLIDVAPPTVTSVTPPNAAVGVSAATMVTAAFNEPIDAATLTPSTFVLRNPANAVVTATVSYNAGSRLATLAPSAPLASSTKYTALVTAGSAGVKDLAGNALASSVLWSFTTADTTPPTVTSATPASGATGISASTAVTATFSEPINAATLATSTFVLRNPANAVVTATVSYNSGTRVGTLTPLAPLAASTTYTATITGGSAGVKDTAGNALASNFVRSFTTAAAVTLGSTTIGSLIDSGDSNALNGSRVMTSAAGRIASMSAYVGNIDSLATKARYQMAIYTDNAGRPGTLVAVSASGTLVANAWNTLALSASLLPRTSYWLMFNTNGRTSSVNNMRFRNGSAGQGAHSNAKVSFGTWPTTFGATTEGALFSLFATLGP